MLPETTLVSGNTYYLYNVEADLFLEYNGTSTSSIGIKENPLPIEITLLENGAYTMRVTTITNGYIYSASTSGCSTNHSSYGAGSTYSYWTITENEGSYLIQRSSLNTRYYDANQYLGWQGDNATSILPDRPITDGVHWKLIPADGCGDRYVASLKLYKALEMADLFASNGWNIDYYNDLYAAHTTADIEDMANAAYGLRNGLNMSQGYKAPYWNEYPILWQLSDNTDKWELYSDSKRFTCRVANGKTSTIKATVVVDEPSTFVYGVYEDNNTYEVKIYVDDMLCRTLKKGQMKGNYSYYNSNDHPFFEDLMPGTHTIKFVAISPSDTYCYYGLRAGVVKSPTISVSLLEPGSLGTEVLNYTDHIKNVRRLRIQGQMNNDDWNKIKMMTKLQEIDLSNAVIAEIPEDQFKVGTGIDTCTVFLHSIKLPEGLKKINNGAFFNSYIDFIQLPSTVTYIGQSAFSKSYIKELLLPDNIVELPTGSFSGGSPRNSAFYEMMCLERIVCPQNLESIPNYCFYGNSYCQEVVLNENTKTIGDYAFYKNDISNIIFPEGLMDIGKYSFADTNGNYSTFPQTLKTIGNYAFYNCNNITNLIIPQNVELIQEGAFWNCNNISTVELGVSLYKLYKIFNNCDKIATVRLNSPTVVNIGNSYPIEAELIKNIHLYVPNHLVTSYKLDDYWYNFKSIEGFSTSEIEDWTINRPLVLNRERFEGTPTISIKGSIDRMPSLKINGDTPMAINDLYFRGSYSNTYYNYPGQILSNCSNITVTGNVQTTLWSKAKYWYFYSLPFDIKISEITHSADGVQKAVRYYDGANRAANGASGSWKNYTEDAVIPAGTGFIMQTNVDTWNYFHALDNANKQQCVKNTEFVTTLAVNDCENKSNKGWNLVGNPWQCYYNDHALNFTGPITVWSVGSKTYTAYSITDDDYAIAPNEAFFVQCPSEQYNTIGFPTNGRQLTNVIESQNAAKTSRAASRRMIVDVKISNGENEDQTRVVLNEQASLDYEMTCDASKMMSMDASVPQIFTMDADGTQYAINERPTDTAIVPLGFFAPTYGNYSISLGRNNTETVILVDYETGKEQNIIGAAYNFTANAGMNEGRFALKFSAGETTGISNVESTENSAATVYNLAGQRISRGVKGISIINGRKTINK